MLRHTPRSWSWPVAQSKRSSNLNRQSCLSPFYMYRFCCKELQTALNFVDVCLKNFSNFDPREIDDVLQTVVDSVLVNVVCKHLEDRLLHSSSCEHIVQILINLQHFTNFAVQLEDELIPEKISSTREKTNFAATGAENRLFEVLKEVVDGFVVLADYECLNDISAEKASEYLHGLVNYVDTLMTTTLLRLPE
jgi:hypothetical protein